MEKAWAGHRLLARIIASQEDSGDRIFCDFPSQATSQASQTIQGGMLKQALGYSAAVVAGQHLAQMISLGEFQVGSGEGEISASFCSHGVPQRLTMELDD